MKTFDFAVYLNSGVKTVRICAENSTIARNLIELKFPANTKIVAR